MTLADYALAVFVVLNGGQAAAHFPQIVRIYRDPSGANAVSLFPWALFAAANIATVGYALAISDDRFLATYFALNAAACLAIVALGAFRRLGLGHDVLRFRSSAGPRDAPRNLTPSVTHRDEMIRQGLFG